MSAKENKMAAKLAQVQRDKPQAVAAAPAQRVTDYVAPSRPAVQKAGRWEDVNRRATFHMPNDLLAQLERFCDRSGRNKSEVVRAAVATYIDRAGGQ